MLPLKIEEEKQNELNKNNLPETELEQWENLQLDIFSDILISLILKSSTKSEADEK